MISQRQSMTTVQRTDRVIKPIKPLDSGRNRDARPMMFSNTEDFEDSGGSGSDDHMDKLLAQTNTDVRESSGRAVQEIKRASEVGPREGPVGSTLNKTTPGLPPRRQSILPTAPVTTQRTSGGLPLPPKTPSSGLPLPPKTPSSGLPLPPKTTSSGLPFPPKTPASTNLPLPPGMKQNSIGGSQNLDKKTLPMPPLSTRSTMPMPPSSIKKTSLTSPKTEISTNQKGKSFGNQQQEIDRNSILNFDEVESNMSEAELRQLRQKKVRDAQRLKEDVQAELARNELLKLSGMTAEEQRTALEEKKRQEELKKMMTDSQRKQLEAETQQNQEIQQLRQQIAAYQADINRTVVTNQKLKEIASKITQSKQQLAAQGLLFESELQQAQEDQNKVNSGLKITRETTKDYLELKAAIEGKSSEVQQRFLKYEVEKQKTNSALIELNSNLEQQSIIQRQLKIKLDEEKDGKEYDVECLLDLYYEQIERQYRRKDKLQEKLAEAKWQHTLNMEVLVQRRGEKEPIDESLETLTNYDQECGSTLIQQQEELETLQKVHETNVKIRELEAALEANAGVFEEEVRNANSELSEVSQLLESTNSYILEQQNKIALADSVMPDLTKRLQEIQQTIFKHKVEHTEAEKNLDQAQDKHSKLTQDFEKEKSQNQLLENQYDQELANRLQFFDTNLLQANLKLLEIQQEISHGKDQSVQFQQKQTDLKSATSEFKIFLTETQSIQINLTTQEDFQKKKLDGIQKYEGECENHALESRGALELLQNHRVLNLAEAIKMHLVQEKLEYAADQQILKLQENIQMIQDEIFEYTKQKSVLEENILTFNEQETAHKVEIERSKQENLEYELLFVSTITDLEQHSAALIEAETIQTRLQATNLEFDSNQNQVNIETDLYLTQIRETDTEINNVIDQVSNQKLYLSEAQKELSALTVEFEQITRNMVETNPDFEKQRVELVMYVQTESHKSKELEESLMKYQRRIAEFDQQSTQLQADIQAEKIINTQIIQTNKEFLLKVQTNNNEQQKTFQDKLSNNRQNSDKNSKTLNGLDQYQKEINQSVVCQEQEHTYHSSIFQAWVKLKTLNLSYTDLIKQLHFDEEQLHDEKTQVQIHNNQVSGEHETHKALHLDVGMALTGLVNLVENLDMEINQHKSTIAQTDKQSEQCMQHVFNVTDTLRIEKAGLEEQHTEWLRILETRESLVSEILQKTTDLITKNKSFMQNEAEKAFNLNQTGTSYKQANSGLQQQDIVLKSQKEQLLRNKTTASEILNAIFTYLSDSGDLITTGKNSFSMLRDERLAHLQEIIKGHLDEKEKEEFFDAQIRDLRQKIKLVRDEIEEYTIQKSTLEQTTLLFNEQETKFRVEIERSQKEHSEQQSLFVRATTLLEQHSAALIEADTIQTKLKADNLQFDLDHNQVNLQTELHLTRIRETDTENNVVNEQVSKQLLSLSEAQKELSVLTVELGQITNNMIQTNPDFEKQRVELVMNVQTESQKSKELEAILIKQQSTIAEFEQLTAQSQADIQIQNKFNSEMLELNRKTSQKMHLIQGSKDQVLKKINYFKTIYSGQVQRQTEFNDYLSELSSNFVSQREEHSCQSQIFEAWVKLKTLHQSYSDLVQELYLNEGEVQDEQTKVQSHHEKVTAEHESHEILLKDLDAAVTDIFTLTQNLAIEINQHKSEIYLTDQQSEECMQHFACATDALNMEKTCLDQSHREWLITLESRELLMSQLLSKTTDLITTNQQLIKEKAEKALDLQQKETYYQQSNSGHQKQGADLKKLKDQLYQSQTIASGFFTGMMTYMSECGDQATTERTNFEMLRDDRLSHLSETIKGQLDDQEKEAFIDAQINDLQSKIKLMSDDFKEYTKLKSVLEQTTFSFNEQETKFRVEIERSQKEHSEHESLFVRATTLLEQYSAALIEADTISTTLKATSIEFDSDHNQLIQYTELNSIRLRENDTEIIKVTEQVSNQQLTLSVALKELQDLTSDLQLITGNMVQTNPDFEQEYIILQQQVKAESQKLQELDASFVQFQTNSQRIEQQITQLQAAIQTEQKINSELMKLNKIVLQNQQTTKDLQKQAQQKLSVIYEQIEIKKNTYLRLQQNLNEYNDLLSQGKKQLEDLQNQRQLYLVEQIKEHFDTEQKEAFFDQQIAQYTQQISEFQFEIEEYAKQKASLDHIMQQVQLLLQSQHYLIQQEVESRDYVEQLESIKIELNQNLVSKNNCDSEIEQELQLQSQLNQQISEVEIEVYNFQTGIAEKEQELNLTNQMLSDVSEQLKTLQSEVLEQNDLIEDGLQIKLNRLQDELQKIESSQSHLNEQLKNSSLSESEDVKINKIQLATQRQQIQHQVVELQIVKQSQEVKQNQSQQYSQEINELVSQNQNQLQQMQQLHLVQLNEQIELQNQQVADAAAPVVESVGGKRRHARNISMIGQLAATTFEVRDKSQMTQSQVEEKVLKALHADSQGQRVVVVDQKDLIEEVKDEIIQRRIEEVEEEGDESSLENRQQNVLQFGAVGPLSQDNTLQPHIRQSSAGSVQVPLNQEQEQLDSVAQNKTPTVPVPTVGPLEYRPSIFDMKKQNKQGSYRATNYDKVAPTKRFSMAIAQKLSFGSNQQSHQHEDNVLGDLLICLLSQQQILNIHSDFEISQGFALFQQLYLSDPKCHEAIFGLGRINYIQGRYEIAEKLFIKAYEVKRDFVYRVWLGFTQYMLFKVCTPENPKKMKIALNALQNLDRCSKENKVGLYANFGLLYLSLAIQDLNQTLQGCQNPQVYANQVKQYGVRYEAKLAQAVVQIRSNASEGLKLLTELTQEDNRPHAHYVLINHALLKKEFSQARQLAERAYHDVTEYDSFQERLTLILLLCKCFIKDNQPHQALLQIQMQYTESPHFSSLLYLYGKYIITTKSLHQQLLETGMSALQEVIRVSCQVRQAKASYLLSESYLLLGLQTQAGLYQTRYLNAIKQVVKSGPIKQKLIAVRVDASIQMQILKAIGSYQWENQIHINPLLVSPVDSMDDQAQEPLPEIKNPANLLTECSKINSVRDQQLYRAICQYRILQDFESANINFMKLIQNHPTDVELHLENIKFLRKALSKNFNVARPKSADEEARHLLNLIKQKNLPADIWTDSLIECAKIFHKIFMNSQSQELMHEGLECLLQIRHCLPVIDTKIAEIKLPGNADRFMSEEFDNIDFQASAQGSVISTIDQESDQFRPQDDYDESNRFFFQTRNAQTKLQICPLASLSIAEIRDMTRNKGDQIFYFGAVQTDLAYQFEENKGIVAEHKYYKSSTPLIAVIRYLQHLKRVNNQTAHSHQIKEEQSVNAIGVIDPGFCVMSRVDFLYTIAKMCAKSGQFIDLAVQSLHQYKQVAMYYRHFDKHKEFKIMKAKVVLAIVLKKMSTDQAQDLPVVENLLQEVAASVKNSSVQQIQGSQQEHFSQKVNKLLLQAQQ